MSRVMMNCGHAANAQDSDGNPSCAICIGLKPGATTVNNSPPDLTDRIAACGTCGSKKPSSSNLPFFEYRPDRENDSFYCGCWGWG